MRFQPGRPANGCSALRPTRPLRTPGGPGPRHLNALICRWWCAFVFLSIWPTRPTHNAYAVEVDPGGPLFKLRTAITGALSAGGRPQTHPAIAAVDVSSMLNRPKAPAESLLPGDSLTIPAAHLATHDESKRPSPNGKGPLTCYFVVAGAGFEPATSGR
jgi:hypothetical protein